MSVFYKQCITNFAGRGKVQTDPGLQQSDLLFFTLWWCESDTHLLESVHWILNVRCIKCIFNLQYIQVMNLIVSWGISIQIFCKSHMRRQLLCRIKQNPIQNEAYSWRILTWDPLEHGSITSLPSKEFQEHFLVPPLPLSPRPDLLPTTKNSQLLSFLQLCHLCRTKSWQKRQPRPPFFLLHFFTPWLKALWVCSTWPMCLSSLTSQPLTGQWFWSYPGHPNKQALWQAIPSTQKAAVPTPDMSSSSPFGPQHTTSHSERCS